MGSLSRGDRIDKLSLSVGKGGGSQDWVAGLQECKTQVVKANLSSLKATLPYLSIVKKGKQKNVHAVYYI